MAKNNMKRIEGILLAGVLLLPSACVDMVSPRPENVPANASNQPVATTQPVAMPSLAQPSLFSPLPIAAQAIDPNVSALGAETGTEVGKRVVQIRGDLVNLRNLGGGQLQRYQQLRQQSESDASLYFNLTANLNARLQAGTTPGNPRLVQAWDQSSAALDRFAANTTQMSQLSNEINNTAATGAFLLEATRATFDLTGAVDEDHANLKILEDDLTRLLMEVDRLTVELNNDIERQNNYIQSERRTLQMLALAVSNGELYGTSIGNRPIITLTPIGNIAPSAQSPLASSDVTASNQRPLVSISFSDANTAFERQLYSAVSQTLDRFPQASFDVVGISPIGGNAAHTALSVGDAKKHTEKVLRAMNKMGVPAERLNSSLASSPDIQSTEVRIFVR